MYAFRLTCKVSAGRGVPKGFEMSVVSGSSFYPTPDEIKAAMRRYGFDESVVRQCGNNGYWDARRLTNI